MLRFWWNISTMIREFSEEASLKWENQIREFRDLKSSNKAKAVLENIESSFLTSCENNEEKIFQAWKAVRCKAGL